jgi:pantoate kinase
VSHWATVDGKSKVFVPCAVSSFFEIYDRAADGSKIKDLSRIGARGGGFVIEKGTLTTAEMRKSLRKDQITINGALSPQAKTTSNVIRLMRSKYHIPFLCVSHKVNSPIGAGFGTSGSGALGTACAISRLFRLKLTLAQISLFAHEAEILSVTGLGTVISLTSGVGCVGLVTEPGSYSVGRVDAIPLKGSDYVLFCAHFGAVEKSLVLRNEQKRKRVNEFGRLTLDAVLSDPTPENLLKQSRLFAEAAGLASTELLKLVDKAVEIGAVGATQNMIGNAVHCLVRKAESKNFRKDFSRYVATEQIFESRLVQSGPVFLT